MPLNFITGLAIGAVGATTVIFTVQGIQKHVAKQAAEKAKAESAAQTNS